MQVTVGADPEVFVVKNGKPFCAHGMVPGTKHNPHKVKDGAVQVDGFALEFNTDPASTAKQFVHNIHSVFSTLESMIPEDCKLHVFPSVRFDWGHMRNQPKEALELGCDPDYNAYTGKENIKPNGDTNLRTAAGHVHLGWTSGADPHDDAHFESCRSLTRQLDFFLGIPSLILDEHGDERRQLYGKAGAFRPKSYGCEYRVLSNFWLRNKMLTEWVFVTAQAAIASLISGNNLFEKYGDVAKRLIDGEGKALEKIDNFSEQFPELMMQMSPYDGNKLRGINAE